MKICIWASDGSRIAKRKRSDLRVTHCTRNMVYQSIMYTISFFFYVWSELLTESNFFLSAFWWFQQLHLPRLNAKAGTWHMSSTNRLVLTAGPIPQRPLLIKEWTNGANTHNWELKILNSETPWRDYTIWRCSHRYCLSSGGEHNDFSNKLLWVIDPQ